MPHEELTAAADAGIGIRITTTSVEAHAVFSDRPDAWQRLLVAITAELNLVVPPQKGRTRASND